MQTFLSSYNCCFTMSLPSCHENLTVLWIPFFKNVPFFLSYHCFDMNFLLNIQSFHKKRKTLLFLLSFQNWVDHKILVNGNCMKYCQTVMRHNFVARNFCLYYFWVLKSTYFGEWLNKLLILFLKVTLHCFIWSFQWIYSFQFPMNQTSIQYS